MILPSPAASFEWVQTPFGPALVCRMLEPIAPHLFTSRQWQLGLPAPEPGRDASWSEVARALEVEPDRLMRVRQVHGAGVVTAREPTEVQLDADIIVSHNPALAVAIQAADCVPLLLADRRTGAVAAAHAGWRGLAARVPGVAIAALECECGSRPGDLIAAAGPSIGACCYEVGPDVREGFAKAGFGVADLDRWFLRAPVSTSANRSMPRVEAKRHAGHLFFDGWASTRDQLISAGLPAAQIFIAETCTASHPDTFCSYRRDGPPAGRLAGGIRCAARRP